MVHYNASHHHTLTASLFDVLNECFVRDVVHDMGTGPVGLDRVLERNQEDLPQVVDHVSHVTKGNAQLLNTARLWITR